MLSLSEGTIPGAEWLQAVGSSTYAVLVDELQVTEHLPLDQAKQTLDKVAETIIHALQPPEL